MHRICKRANGLEPLVVMFCVRGRGTRCLLHAFSNHHISTVMWVKLIPSVENIPEASKLTVISLTSIRSHEWGKTRVNSLRYLPPPHHPPGLLKQWPWKFYIFSLCLAEKEILCHFLVKRNVSCTECVRLTLWRLTTPIVVVPHR